MSVADLFPDIEAWAVGYLTPALAARSEPYCAGAEVSNSFQTGYTRQVVVRRDGGFESDVVFDNPRLTIRVWAGNDADATDLALMVAALIKASPGDGIVTRARKLSGPSAVTEENEDLRLRYLSFDLTVRGTQLTFA